MLVKMGKVEPEDIQRIMHTPWTCMRMHASAYMHAYAYMKVEPEDIQRIDGLFARIDRDGSKHACTHIHPSIHPSIHAHVRTRMHGCMHAYIHRLDRDGSGALDADDIAAAAASSNTRDPFSSAKDSDAGSAEGDAEGEKLLPSSLPSTPSKHRPTAWPAQLGAAFGRNGLGGVMSRVQGSLKEGEGTSVLGRALTALLGTLGEARRSVATVSVVKLADAAMASVGLVCALGGLHALDQAELLHPLSCYSPPMLSSAIILFAGPTPPPSVTFVLGTAGAFLMGTTVHLMLVSAVAGSTGAQCLAAGLLLFYFKVSGAFLVPSYFLLLTSYFLLLTSYFFYFKVSGAFLVPTLTLTLTSR